MTNPHSVPWLRVNNVVSNMPEFQKAFGCKAGQPMVHAAAVPGVVNGRGLSGARKQIHDHVRSAVDFAEAISVLCGSARRAHPVRGKGRAHLQKHPI